MQAPTPVVFLHAFPLNANMWRRQLDALDDHPTLAPHFPGFGGRAPANADLDAFAQTVLEDMDGAGIGRAVVVGLSMGGYVAFRLHAWPPNAWRPWSWPTPERVRTTTRERPSAPTRRPVCARRVSGG
jgi:pimeloyl-ACP methyl ester carboxylesterase